MHFVADYRATTGIITSEASLTFVDPLSLAKEIKKLQIVCCFRCVFSHDLNFENGFGISLTSHTRTRRRKHYNGFSILIGMNVLFHPFFLLAYLSTLARKMRHNARQSDDDEP